MSDKKLTKLPSLKSLRSENHTPRFQLLIEALGPMSCKNLNKFSKKCPNNLFFATISGPSHSACSIRHEYAGQSVPRKG